MADKSNLIKLKEYLETSLLFKDGKVDTKYLPKYKYDYEIYQTNSTPILKEYADGSSLRQITFDLNITAGSKEEILDVANSKLNEDLGNWIEEQNKKEILPDIEGVQKIETLLLGHILEKNNLDNIYNIRLRMIYIKMV